MDRTRIHGDASVFIDNILDIHTKTVQQLEASSVKYKIVVDSHRRHIVFNDGDLVWVHLTRDRMPFMLTIKLKSKKTDPIKIVVRINDNVYRVQLPFDITTSDIFNVLFFTKNLPPYESSDLWTNPTHFRRRDAASSIQDGANVII